MAPPLALWTPMLGAKKLKVVISEKYKMFVEEKEKYFVTTYTSLWFSNH